MSFWTSLGKVAASAANFIPVVGPFIGDFLGDQVSQAESKEARKQQMSDSKSMMNYQNELNMANWREQTEYNTPANQLARYKSAGINPLSVGVDGGSASTPASVSGQSAPDIGSILNYQLEAMRARQDIAASRAAVKGQEIENKAASAEADARIAEAHNRETEANALAKEYGKPSITPPEGEGWQYDSSDNTFYRINGNTVEMVLNDQRVNDIIRARVNRELSESHVAQVTSAMQDFELQLRKRYGDSLQAAELNRIVTQTASAALNNRLTQLDVDFYESLGVSQGTASGIVNLARGLVKILATPGAK